MCRKVTPIRTYFATTLVFLVMCTKVTPIRTYFATILVNLVMRVKITPARMEEIARTLTTILGRTPVTAQLDSRAPIVTTLPDFITKGTTTICIC